MRKLASIQVIETIKPIEGADNIECATVQGWEVVVKRGEFQPGDLCVYCEIDSVLPHRPEFAFLAPSYRVKTIRLRGQISQGVCFDLSVLSDGLLGGPQLQIGQDVTDDLEIVKYEAPGVGAGSHSIGKSTFPSYVPRTDEKRIQGARKLLYRLKGELCYATIKMDGTSATYASRWPHISVCSRNQEVERLNKSGGTSPYWRMFDRYDMGSIFMEHNNIAIQGEMVGFFGENKTGAIQKNRMGALDTDLYIFSVWDIVDKRYFNFAEMQTFCDIWKLQMVPLIGTFVLDHSIADLLEMAKVRYANGATAEGIVIRTVGSAPHSRNRASFKVINNDYLLKHGG